MNLQGLYSIEEGAGIMIDTFTKTNSTKNYNCFFVGGQEEAWTLGTPQARMT